MNGCDKIYKEGQNVKVVFVTVEVAMSTHNLKKYILADEKLVASHNWVRDPFRTTPERRSHKCRIRNFHRLYRKRRNPESIW